MRVNVYSQELTSEVKLIGKVSDGRRVTGLPYRSDGSIGPREELDEKLADRWVAIGKPESMVPGIGTTYIQVREEPIVYSAVQLMLHSSPHLHHPPADDDRSAVTLWLPKSTARREALADALERMAALVRSAPSETGLD